MRAYYFAYGIVTAASVVVGGFACTMIALEGGGPTFALMVPAVTLLGAVVYVVAGLALALDWRGLVSTAQTIRERGDASTLVKYMTWMPSRVPFVAACRISGGIVVASGIMLLGLFLVMVVHYGAWR